MSVQDLKEHEQLEELEREVRRHRRALDLALDRILEKLRNDSRIDETQGSPETVSPDV